MSRHTHRERPAPPRPRGLAAHLTPVCPASGKRRYRDRHQAQDALLAVRRRRRKAAAACGPLSLRREQRAYRCAGCAGWHLTSWPQIPATSTQPAMLPVTAVAS